MNEDAIPNPTKNSKKAAKVAEKGVCQDEVSRILAQLLNDHAREDRSLRQRRAYNAKALRRIESEVGPTSPSRHEK